MQEYRQDVRLGTSYHVLLLIERGVIVGKRIETNGIGLSDGTAFRLSRLDKQSKEYNSLTNDEKLMYEYCLSRSGGSKDFELNYDEFITWLASQDNSQQTN